MLRVLLALDGSPPSLVARDLVASLAWPAQTTVHIVAAYQVPVDFSGGVGSTIDWVRDAEKGMHDELAVQLAAAAKPLVASGLAVECHVLRGRAADVITEVGVHLAVDLVVTGSRGRGRLPSMLLGSVASEVASRAPCPVLVARADRISRVLVAADGSFSAARIPDWLTEAGILRGLPADAVAVSIPDGPAFELIVGLYTLGDKRLARKRAELRERYRADAEAMAKRLTSIGMPASPLLRAGDPAHQILAAAAERGADLIVTGSRGIEGLERLLLGSVARNVLAHAPCSVLIVRPLAHHNGDRVPVGENDKTEGESHH